MFYIKNFSVVRLDSKGRIIVPFHIRDFMSLKEGQELVVANNGTKELKIYPLVAKMSAKINITFQDSPGSLSSILDAISNNNINILTSVSKTLEKGKLAEWSGILDTSNCENFNSIENSLKKMKIVQKINMVKNM